jgi:hypothetical protein
MIERPLSRSIRLHQLRSRQFEIGRSGHKISDFEKRNSDVLRKPTGTSAFPATGKNAGAKRFLFAPTPNTTIRLV